MSEVKPGFSRGKRSRTPASPEYDEVASKLGAEIAGEIPIDWTVEFEDTSYLPLWVHWESHASIVSAFPVSMI